MAALSADRNYRTRSTARSFPMKMAASAIVYQGGLVAVGATGYGAAASTTAGVRVMGWATAQTDNTGGADGALLAQVAAGASIKLDNDGTNPVSQADVGRLCFVKDDHTVQTGAGGSSVIAGRVDSLDADGGVWVFVDDIVGGIDGKAVDTVADNNTNAGVPLVHVFNIADAATGDHDIVINEKFEVLDVTVIKNGAGAGNTVQIKNGATAISDAIAAAVDKTVTRAGTIDYGNNVISAGGTLRATVTRAAGSGAMKVIVTGRKAA